jgi:hypothetical protein
MTRATLFSVAALGAALAVGTLGAQSAPPTRFGLGATILVAGLTNSEGMTFVGAEGFLRLSDGSFVRTRLDGAIYGAAGPSEPGCAILERPCDTRRLSRVGTLMATVLVGPRLSTGLRPIYFLLGVGAAATTWGGGSYLENGVEKRGVGFGPTVAIAQAGLGSEFRLLGADRIELRMHISTRPPNPSFAPNGPNDGGGLSLALGHVW